MSRHRWSKYTISLGLFFMPLGAWALTYQSETEIGREFLFDSAKRYLLLNYSQGLAKGESLFELEDRSAGFIRFTFREDDFVDRRSVIEIIELSPSRSKLRISIPEDQLGRPRILTQKIIRFASEEVKGGEGKEFPFSALDVYRSSKRYVLKTFSIPGQSIEEVIQFDQEDVGLLKFVYRQNHVVDRDARIYVIPLGKGSCRLVVKLPGRDAAHRLLLEDKLSKAIEEDLGDQGKVSSGS